jgi:hypothetical protein
MCRRDNSWPCDDVGSYYCLYWSCVSWATWERTKHTALLHKGTVAPNCTPGTCNPVNFTVLRPSDWTRGHVIVIRIDEKGLDPGSLMHLKVVTVTHEISSYQVFHSFYEEMRSKFSISAKTKNLCLSLAESIAQTLNVTSCCLWGTNIGDHWPWEARELDPQEPFNETAFLKHRKGVWLLKTSIIGNDTAQEIQRWGAPNHTDPQPLPLASFSNFRKAWDNLTTNIDWQACRRLYWICGKQAYTVLPSRWFGFYVLDSIRPSFFFCFPSNKVKKLGVPIYIKKD